MSEVLIAAERGVDRERARCAIAPDTRAALVPITVMYQAARWQPADPGTLGIGAEAAAVTAPLSWRRRARGLGA